MGIEIERKFLLANKSWKENADQGKVIQQGYLNSNKDRTVRIRIADTEAFLTIKGKNDNLTRKEFEYPIDLNEAKELLLLCEKPLIEKTRFIVLYQGNTWEIDVFEGDNEGLIIAEVELANEQQKITLPEWIGEEVSSDPRYYNSSLISNPYTNW